MTTLDSIKYYLNPIVYSLFTIGMYVEVVRQLRDYLSINESILKAIDAIYPLIIVSVVIWFFLHYLASWVIAIIQFGVGVYKYSKYREKLHLQNCYSAIIVTALYLLVIFGAHEGFFVDA
ncbi:MAG: hypothetical protein JAZ17_26785 [Candidatus Thiodiazotropha endolucinida]|nr:hypothetical protein [Candidatus Thiodiazotropha endolucinida]